MELSLIIPVAAGCIAVACLAFLLYLRFMRTTGSFRDLMGSEEYTSAMAGLRESIKEDESGDQLERFQSVVRQQQKKKGSLTTEEKMFQAGIFSEGQKNDFKRLQVLMPIIGVFVFALIGRALGGLESVFLCAVIGIILGFYLPIKILDRRVKARLDDILFYLPLVIEQVSIGVSSSLDIGPCIMRIVQMADERDTHNAVTELLRYAQFHIKSGAGLEEALNEVGRMSGSHDLKHTFMALSQVAKFGGEISKQLQDMADSVASQRESQIDERIKKLELDATGPVALVFFGFLVILLIGFGLQIITQI